MNNMEVPNEEKRMPKNKFNKTTKHKKNEKIEYRIDRGRDKTDEMNRNSYEIVEQPRKQENQNISVSNESFN